jgi:GT2 family glycosyltransferase
VAVLVAHNRRELMLAALDALSAQTRPVDHIVVVDNASTDSSAQAAREHPCRPEVLALSRNTGGAGGFAIGMAHAITARAAGACWLMDDDTIPAPDALAELEAAWAAYPGQVALACSRAVWTDGRDHPMNTPRARPFASAALRRAARAVGAMPVRSGSFVSMLVDGSAAAASGLPVADYFIWNDDFEFSTRLLRHAVGLYVPASVVEHRTVRFAGAGNNPGPRFYYDVRNKLWTFMRRRTLGPLDLLAYGAVTYWGWAMAFMRAPFSGKAELLRWGWRGARDALLAGPKPNSVTLAGFGALTAQVEALEGKWSR